MNTISEDTTTSLKLLLEAFQMKKITEGATKAGNVMRQKTPSAQTMPNPAPVRTVGYGLCFIDHSSV